MRVDGIDRQSVARPRRLLATVAGVGALGFAAVFALSAIGRAAPEPAMPASTPAGQYAAPASGDLAGVETLAHGATTIAPVRPMLAGHSAMERAQIKGRQIAKLPTAGTYVDVRYGYEIELGQAQAIAGGVEVFARAWKGGAQVGFGRDGSVEWERFRILNPPVMAPDGTRGSVTFQGSTFEVANFSEDPLAALREVVAHNVSLIGKPGAAVIPGKIGNTTTTVYPDADPETASVDGDADHANSSWATLQGATSGSGATPSSIYGGPQSGKNGGACPGSCIYAISRTFLLFDTSSIPDGDTIDSATLSVYVYATDNGDNDGDDWLNVFATTPASNTDIVVGDFDQTGTTEQSDSRHDLSSVSENAYLDWTLNATGRGNISDTGVTRFGLREGHDALNLTYAGIDNSKNRLSLKLADTAGTTQDPKLVVVHTAPDSGWVFLTTTYAYDAWGNVATTTDPRGNSTAYTYDPTYHTYLTQVTYPAVSGGAFTTSYTWDYVKGVKLSETDWNGNVTSFEYDAIGRPTRVIRPGDDSTNPTERYSYLNWGTQGQQRVKVEQKTSGSDYLWQEEYFDGLGRIVQVRQQDDFGFSAITASTKFNSRQLVASSYAPFRITATTTAAYQSPSGIESTEYSYDALGRVLTATSTDGSVTTHVYEGHPDSFLLWEERITDPLGKEKRYSTDVYGRMARVQEMQGAQVYRTTSFSYDTLGNLTLVVVDPQLDSSLLNATTTMTYDWLGRKLSLDNPDTGAWSYAYDANGNLTSQTDARGQVLTFEYDALNRQTKKCAINCSATVLATYAYDSGTNGRGHRTWMTDGSGSATSTFDARGRLTQEVKVIQGSSYTTGYAYDSADRLTSVTLPGGEVITLAFNDRGLPLSATSSASGTIASGANYNRLGLLTQLDSGENASRTTQEYWGVEHSGTTTASQFGRLYRQLTVQVSGTSTFQDLRYTWDSAGNLTQREDALHSTTESFSYDDFHRLTSATSTSPETYTYDAHDNITFKTGPGSYTYGTSTKPHLLTGTTQNPGAYSYDANGNTTSRPGQTLTWNSENWLASVFDTAAGTTTESYLYDGEGIRVVQTSSSEGTVHYVNRFYQKDVTSGTTTVTYWLADGLVAVKAGASVQFIHADHLGSAAARSDPAGTGAWRGYFPYGAVRTSSGTIAGDRSFTGQRVDTPTGLYFYNARYYDPDLGRFISPDSLVADPYDPSDYNRFSYVLNNPLKYTDPTGQFVYCYCFVASGFYMGAAGAFMVGYIWDDRGNRGVLLTGSLGGGVGVGGSVGSPLVGVLSKRDTIYEVRGISLTLTGTAAFGPFGLGISASFSEPGQGLDGVMLQYRRGLHVGVAATVDRTFIFDEQDFDAVRRAIDRIVEGVADEILAKVEAQSAGPAVVGQPDSGVSEDLIVQTGSEGNRKPRGRVAIE